MTNKEYEKVLKELNPYYREYIKELYGCYPEQLITKIKSKKK